MNNEEFFDPFAGAVVCDCTKRPEVIGRIIPTAFGDEEECFICGWCQFVRDFGMEDNLEDIESKTIAKPMKNNTYDEYDAYEDEYLDNLYGLEDLEDYGAFSDEGIMPGCHSDYAFSEFGNLEEFCRNYQECENMRKFFGGVIAFARESLGLSVECLAEETSLPKYIIENIEAGEADIKVEDMTSITPVSLACASDVPKRKRLWWEDKGETEIEEVVKNYLIKRKNALTEAFPMCQEENNFFQNSHIQYSHIKENLQIFVNKGTKAGLLFDKDGQSVSKPVLTRNSLGTIQEALFVYCVDRFDMNNVSTPTEWLKFNVSDGKFVLYADRSDYDFFDSRVEIPKYVYKEDEAVGYSDEIRVLYEEIKKFAFRDVVSKREKEILVRYRSLMFAFSTYDLRPFYYVLGRAFFDWIDTVKVVEYELPF